MSVELVSVAIASVEDVPRLAWAAGREFSVPRAVAVQLGGFEREQFVVTASSLGAHAGAIEQTRSKAAFTDCPPTSARLPFSYQMVPLSVRTLVGRAIGYVQRRRESVWASYPRWPLDLSADFVADLCGVSSPFADRPTPVLLTHDLDTLEGLRNVVVSFLPIEEAVGARSANYVVPCGWPLDHGLLGEIAGRGHEIGVHGFDHSNRTPFADAEERRRRIEAARPVVERYKAIGYRAPSLVRTKELLDDLQAMYAYDSSIPTSGGLFPVPNNGCASARPFKIGSLLEIPVTMPRDGSLRFLGYGANEILKLWLQCAEQISASGGVINLLTHCEKRFCGNPLMLDAYRRLVSALATDPRYQFTTPAEILRLNSSSFSTM